MQCLTLSMDEGFGVAFKVFSSLVITMAGHHSSSEHLIQCPMIIQSAYLGLLHLQRDKFIEFTLFLCAQKLEALLDGGKLLIIP